MSKRLSELYGMDIFTEKAEHVGRVEDVIVNLEKGEIMQLSLRSFKPKSIAGLDVRKILQEESISFEEIVRIGDIIICKKDPRAEKKRRKT
ncbi:MAG: hypothetical protein DRO92_02235 [Candidatus Altiarchaeales archaeon]|nr:MAG: hypothetical protein DRO92_02235 [Candidatus Altiarchaeales archaeon]